MQAATPPPRSPKATNPILRRARGFILATSIVLAGLCLAGPALAATTGTTAGLVSAASARAAAQCSGKFAMVNTCLLYTSPSPRDRTRSRMPSSA